MRQELRDAEAGGDIEIVASDEEHTIYVQNDDDEDRDFFLPHLPFATRLGVFQGICKGLNVRDDLLDELQIPLSDFWKMHREAFDGVDLYKISNTRITSNDAKRVLSKAYEGITIPIESWPGAFGITYETGMRWRKLS